MRELLASHDILGRSQRAYGVTGTGTLVLQMAVEELGECCSKVE